MNKAELVDKVAAEAGVEKRQAEAVLSASAISARACLACGARLLFG